MNDKYNHLTDHIQEVRLIKKKDMDATKEINQLKKQDQIESYQRGKAMQQMYKESLINKVMNKKAKGDTVKLKQIYNE